MGKINIMTDWHKAIKEPPPEETIEFLNALQVLLDEAYNKGHVAATKDIMIGWHGEQPPRG